MSLPLALTNSGLASTNRQVRSPHTLSAVV